MTEASSSCPPQDKARFGPFGMSLRKGVLFIGCLSMICCYSVIGYLVFDSHLNSKHYTQDTEDKIVASGAILVAVMLTGLLLVVGVLRKKPVFLVPYMIAGYLMIVILVIIMIVSKEEFYNDFTHFRNQTTEIQEDARRKIFRDLAIIISLIIVQTYFLRVVKRYYDELEKSRSRGPVFYTTPQFTSDSNFPHHVRLPSLYLPIPVPYQQAVKNSDTSTDRHVPPSYGDVPPPYQEVPPPCRDPPPPYLDVTPPHSHDVKDEIAPQTV